MLEKTVPEIRKIGYKAVFFVSDICTSQITVMDSLANSHFNDELKRTHWYAKRRY